MNRMNSIAGITTVGVLLSVAGCAAGSGGSDVTRPTTTITRVESPSGAVELQTTRTNSPSSWEIPLPIDKLAPLLARVYTQLEIPISAVDAAAHSIQSTNQRVRRIGGKPLDQFFECGGAYGNSAGRYDLTATIATQLLPARGNATAVNTIASGSARSPSTGGGSVRCASTGRLEQMIADKLAELGGAAEGK